MNIATSLKLAARLARRELRGGLRGFRIFLACLTLGVAAIAAVQSTSSGLLNSLREDGRAILGGDVALRLLYNPATPEQLTHLQSSGRISTTAEMRAMARLPDGESSSLVELKAVDAPYPLFGTVELAAGNELHTALAQRNGVFGAVVEDAVLQRLGAEVGDRISVGDAVFEVRDIIAREPDRIGGGGFSLGPRLMIGQEALPPTGLLQPGSMIYWNYRLDLAERTDTKAWAQQLSERFPDAGWQVRDYTNASPRLERFIERLTLFLTLVGLTALLVGGVGVSNAVRSYLDGKTTTIATLKCLGAPSGLIFRIYLLQILVLAAGGIVLGLLIGAVAPLVLGTLLADLLPITTRIGVYPGALAIPAGFGVLTALTFSLWPLGRAQGVPAASLFRDAITPIQGRPRGAVLLAAVLFATALAALAILTAQDRLFATWFVVGAAVTMIAFRYAALGIVAVARRVVVRGRPGLRLALSNLHRPGNATGSVVLSLGLGLTVLVAIALIEGNFARQVRDEIPTDAPAFFFIDVQPSQRQAFNQAVLSVPGAHGLEEVPSLRARIARVNGVEAEQALVNPEHAWVLRGDRGITYAAAMPKDTRLLSGKWWPEDYQGEPLISIYKDVADAFGIGLGDQMTINVLGRNITAQVASIREIDWATMTLNFTIIFSPGVLEKAPQTYLATVQSTPEAEAAIQRAVTTQFANITTVRVKDALETVNQILGNIGMAVRVTAGITLVAGTLVLAGAIAAGHRRRVYEAVVLKVLGATRRDVLKAFLLEYGLLGFVTALIASIVGTLTAWAVLTWVMEWQWTFLPSALIATTLLCVAITLALGFAGTWRALGYPAAPLLRNP